MPSEVDICNRALQKLGQKPITSLTDDSPRARDCNRVYEPVRDVELRSHTWNFARARASLAASATPPEFGYDNKFQVPADFLRLVGGMDDIVDWQIEGRYILTDDDAPLEIIYIRVVEDPNEFDALFREALAARIAVELAEKQTQSNTKRELAHKEYKEIVREARRTNAIERISQEPPEDSWITARR